MVTTEQYRKQEEDRKKLFKELFTSKKGYLTEEEINRLFDECKQRHKSLFVSDYYLFKTNPFTYNEARKILKL